jgi:hypothetical protein
MNTCSQCRALVAGDRHLERDFVAVLDHRLAHLVRVQFIAHARVRRSEMASSSALPRDMNSLRVSLLVSLRSRRMTETSS